MLSLSSLWGVSVRPYYQDSDSFESNMQGCNELFRVWDDEVRQFKELVRELIKKRGTVAGSCCDGAHPCEVPFYDILG